MKFTRLSAALALGLFASAALAQTTTLDQSPISYGAQPAGELLIQNEPVTGGNLYVSTVRRGEAIGVASTFVSSSAGGLTRWLRLTDAKADTGVSITATPASGAFGVSRTAGTSLALTGEATSSNAKTDKALFEFSLPDSYVAGANIVVTVNCLASGGTITTATTTMTVAAYSEAQGGTETALSVSAAQQIPATATNLAFTVTGTGLVPGQRVAVELVMLVTTSAGAGTGSVNSVSYGG